MSKVPSIEEVRGGQELPYEKVQDVARRQVEAVVPADLRQRMDRMGQQALELLRTAGVALLDLTTERDAVEAAINEAFGSRACDYELRFAGTGVEVGTSALELIGQLAGGAYSAAEHADAMLGEFGDGFEPRPDPDEAEVAGCQGCATLQRDRGRLHRQVEELRGMLGKALDAHDRVLMERAS